MTSLLVIKGPNVGMRYELKEQTTIGRLPDNTIQVLDPNVSRYHCEIVLRNECFEVRDKGSANGVLLNGGRVTEAVLRSNDELAIGTAVFIFDTDDELKHTRYSNKRILISSAGDDTFPDFSAPRNVGTERSGPAAFERALLLELGNLFSSSRLPLGEALERILGIIHRLFCARLSCLLKFDSVLEEFIPMVAISEADDVTVSKFVIHSVMREKHAILLPLSTVATSVRTLRMNLDDQPEINPEGAALCAPLIDDDNIVGLLYLEVDNPDQILLRDVQLLEAVTTLTQMAVEHTETLDALEKEIDQEKMRDKHDHSLVGSSPVFRQAIELAERVAPTTSTVLLTGETGTGKEVFARHIHNTSARKDYPFIPVNCAAIPEELIESELFGHERGAFTGADKMRRGLIEDAHGGTLMLDEIGEVSPRIQTKLLRFLQDRLITRVGGNKVIEVDVRIIAATNADLQKAVAEKKFRQDLLYRLNVFHINLPPLRERQNDISQLADHFLKFYAQRHHKHIERFSPEALNMLENYDWPGNIRELQNTIERATLLCDTPILQPKHLQVFWTGMEDQPEPAADVSTVFTLAEAEKECIRKALEACDWNQAEAARHLKIHRNTLRKKISDYDLQS